MIDEIYLPRITHYNKLMDGLSIYLHHVEPTDSMEDLKRKVIWNNAIIANIEAMRFANDKEIK